MSNPNVLTSVSVSNSGMGYTSPGVITFPSPTTIFITSVGLNVNPIATTFLDIDRNIAFAIHGRNDKEILKVSMDGEITYNGSINKAVGHFLEVFGHSIDKESVGPAALARSYKRAIERCLRQIKTMEKEEFIALLEKEIDNRTSKEMLEYLKESPDEIEE